MHDLIVIGAGSGGLTAARAAARLGARVALVERDARGPGGDCLWTGCVPSKALIRAGRLVRDSRRGEAFGLAGEGLRCDDLAPVLAKVRETQAEIARHDAAAALAKDGIETFAGEARFLSATEIDVRGAASQRLEARRIIIATGARPALPPVEGLLAARPLTSENVFALARLPRALLVLGGGAIGVELARAFASLGAKVTIVEKEPRLLPLEDEDVSAAVEAAFRRDGILVRTGANLERIEVLDLGGERKLRALSVLFDEVLVATGRIPNADGLDLERAGVARDPRGFIEVDARMQSSRPGIYAVGDVAGKFPFTHGAAAEAFVAVRNALFPGSERMAYEALPYAIFTDPEVGRVGPTEAEARRAHGQDLDVETFPLARSDRAIADRETEGLVKLLALRSGKLLGAHIVGPGAGDIVNEVALALRAGLGVEGLARATHAYPTVALALQQAAGEMVFRRLERPLARRAISLGRWLGRRFLA